MEVLAVIERMFNNYIQSVIIFFFFLDESDAFPSHNAYPKPNDVH